MTALKISERGDARDEDAIRALVTAREDELVALVAGRAFDIVGLTVSVERHVAPLQKSIAAVRRASRNPDIIVLVGGRVFTENPGLAADIGADGTAADGLLAVALADELMQRKAMPDTRMTMK